NPELRDVQGSGQAVADFARRGPRSRRWNDGSDPAVDRSPGRRQRQDRRALLDRGIWERAPTEGTRSRESGAPRQVHARMDRAPRIARLTSGRRIADRGPRRTISVEARRKYERIRRRPSGRSGRALAATRPSGERKNPGGGAGQREAEASNRARVRSARRRP